MSQILNGGMWILNCGNSGNNEKDNLLNCGMKILNGGNSEKASY